MPNRNRLTIQINGIKYPIVTAEEPEYVTELAREMDKTVMELMAVNKSISVNEVLVLLALGYLDLSKKAEANADNLRGQITKYAQDASQARTELLEARREVERLMRKQGGEK